MLTRSHTGIFTTLRRDGMPIATPVWYVVMDRTICIGVPSRTKKVARVAHDPRASFLVESGERWVDLVAVHLTGRVELVDDPEEQARIDAAISLKYAAFRLARSKQPEAARGHYAEITYLRLLPDDRILSWENSRIVPTETAS